MHKSISLNFIKIITALFLSIAVNEKSSAQLTFSQTITYLENIAKNTENLTKKYDEKYTYRITKTKFGTYKTDPKKVLFEYTREFSDNTSDLIQFIFNPKYIESFTKDTETTINGFNFATIKLSGNFVLKVVKQSDVKDYTQNTFSFPYIAGDKLVFERLKAAFLHLKSNSLAQDTLDPFAN